MTRPVLSNWQGSPCPSCGGRLRYVSEEPNGEGRDVHVVLACPDGHCWQESLDARTNHSSIFVERRPELEQPRHRT
jgi:hypothetical protein